MPSLRSNNQYKLRNLVDFFKDFVEKMNGRKFQRMNGTVQKAAYLTILVMLPLRL
jgi:hypothetical protein